MATIRSMRERAFQTILFEAIGLALVTPGFAFATGASSRESFILLATLSAVVMAWAAIFNTLFDLAELRLRRRVASDRPHLCRLLHALLLEVSAIAITAPIVMHLLDFTWQQALIADAGLTAVYMAYGYVFHLCFDRLRPVPREGRSRL